jgi:DEAD/DEAH box helicase domain-containing protein
MMTASRLLSRWRAEPSIAACIQVWHEISPRTARSDRFPDLLHQSLASALHSSGVDELYSHQIASFTQAKLNKHLVIVTGTSSGKTLCYNLPILDCLLMDPDARALYLFPTKALAQDQAATLRNLIQAIPSIENTTQQNLSLAIYDGDTPSHTRGQIRDTARLIFTNPDMLHIGVLPHHTRWTRFFSELRFVVLDEAHIYRGVFGSHVANVIRRLKRIARFYGANPQFILTSATIANPVDLATRLIEDEVVLVDDDGAARGAKTFLIYNPPVVDQDLGLRRSALQESVRLAEDLLANDLQTIIFGRSRRSVELILSYLRQQISSHEGGLSKSLAGSADVEPIRGYRSGYLPARRREIEHGLRTGEVKVVVATNALELGIDIGGMGSALLVGYPGTIAATWQQAGRAGRGAERSLAILVATADPIDQFLASHPEYFFDRSPEQALINADNPLILLDHLRCAAFELPFSTGETFGNVNPAELVEYLSFLADQGVLHQSGSKYFWMADQYPAQTISLRSASANAVQLQVQGEDFITTIGQIDRESAHWMVHPQAIYLHEAETYQVEKLDLEENFALLQPVQTDFYTLPRSETSVQLIQLHESQDVRGGIKSEGEIQVTSQVTGYKKIRWFSHELIDVQPLDMPPVDLLTTGYWMTLSEETVEKLKEAGQWRNEANDYGPNWGVQRQRARQRDNNRCQVCGVLESGRAHHVHHKIPFRMFSSFIHANVLENLITLCPDCHRKVETAVRVRSGLAGLSFSLGNLAPLFLMCDVGDLGVHSDPQSTLAEGNPAVVIYDQIPAGLGFSRRLYELHDELIQRAYELVAACPCTDGCPSCVGPGGEQGAGGKQETLAILKLI